MTLKLQICQLFLPKNARLCIFWHLQFSMMDRNNVLRFRRRLGNDSSQNETFFYGSLLKTDPTFLESSLGHFLQEEEMKWQLFWTQPKLVCSNCTKVTAKYSNDVIGGRNLIKDYLMRRFWGIVDLALAARCDVGGGRGGGKKFFCWSGHHVNQRKPNSRQQTLLLATTTQITHNKSRSIWQCPSTSFLCVLVPEQEDDTRVYVPDPGPKNCCNYLFSLPRTKHVVRRSQKRIKHLKSQKMLLQYIRNRSLTPTEDDFSCSLAAAASSASAAAYSALAACSSALGRS